MSCVPQMNRTDDMPNPCVDGALGSFEDPRMRRQTEIVVRAEVDRFDTIGRFDHRSLRGGNNPLAFVQSGTLDVFKFALQHRLKFVVHV